MQNAIIPTFCFLDESGTLNTMLEDVRHFAVGAIIHSNPDELIHQLHSVFEGFCGDMQKEPTRLEFKAAEVTYTSLKHYIKCLEVLKNDDDWRFCSIVIDLNDPKFVAPRNKLETWECYLRYTKMMLKNNLGSNEKVTLIADYLRKPKGFAHSIDTLPQVVPQLWDVIQVHSQGVILVQMADVLLGSSLYSGVGTVRKELAEHVDALRKHVGRARFNEWRVQWNNTF